MDEDESCEAVGLIWLSMLDMGCSTHHISNCWRETQEYLGHPTRQEIRLVTHSAGCVQDHIKCSRWYKALGGSISDNNDIRNSFQLTEGTINHHKNEENWLYLWWQVLFPVSLALAKRKHAWIWPDEKYVKKECQISWPLVNITCGQSIWPTYNLLQVRTHSNSQDFKGITREINCTIILVTRCTSLRIPDSSLFLNSLRITGED